MTARLDPAATWARIDQNCQRVALTHELIQPGERFRLTVDQRNAVLALAEGLDEGHYEFLLKAPTGSGKTEVLMRTLVDTVLATDGGYGVVVAPTRDLIRQHYTYLTERLEGTGIGVGQIHGGASPAERRAVENGIADGTINIVVGSAMMLTIERYWDMIDRSALLVIDDVNAFDEREHLRLLEDLDCPMIFATATPDELRRFLERIGALSRVVSMKKMPFDVLPTTIHKVEGVWGEPPAEQLSRADALIRDHLARGSRVFVIGRTRSDVPRLAERLEHTYGIPVQQLRGDMADTHEHGSRNRRKGVKVNEVGTRVEMMNKFRAQAPAVLAATNLVGSGIDIPAADLIVITDADAFGESEVEQLIGRVGRRERPSDAVLMTSTTFERNPSRAMVPSGRAKSFMPRGTRARQFDFGRRR
ncbi:MAG TPA: DEAD/DEAH box helicase [Candidatus Sulfotelmatobacter sp.]|nr:DEAD/DEAH box helicase [Candidatus Sulfotelmatobacter sp.]